MLDRLGHNAGIWLAERGQRVGELVDRVVPDVRWLRWALVLSLVWMVMTLSFYFVPGTRYSPSAESHISGDWHKSGAIGLLAAAATFVWLWWRAEWNETP
jgi:heme/copper-type cytochrome/quinol oxidase subunit 2